MIDINKRYRTRDGREVRIYATDGAPASRSVHGALLTERGWMAQDWYPDGVFMPTRESHCDLVEIKPERWHAIFQAVNGQLLVTGEVFASEAEARRACPLLNPIGFWKDPR